MRAVDFGRTRGAVDAGDRRRRLRLDRLMHLAFSRTSMPSASRISATAARDILVLAPDQPIGHLDDRHFAAETPEHLAELEADIAAADDHQMLGRKSTSIIELLVRNGTRSRPGIDRDQGAAADVDEDASAVRRSDPTLTTRRRIRTARGPDTRCSAPGSSQPLLRRRCATARISRPCAP